MKHFVCVLCCLLYKLDVIDTCTGDSEDLMQQSGTSTALYMYSSLIECSKFQLEYYLRQLESCRVDKVSINNKLFKNLSAVSDLSLNVTYMNLASNKIEFISSDFTSMFAELTELILTNNLIDDNIVLIDPLLSSLELVNNQITRLTRKMFENLPLLSSLDLSRNKIVELDADCFTLLPFLTNLKLSKNFIDHLPSGIFKNKNMLIMLDLSFNYLSSLNPNLFIGLENLTSLWLNSNPIKEIGDQAFKYVQNLNNLHLDYLCLSAASFSSLSSLSSLRMKGNRLTSLDNTTFDGLTRLSTLDLKSNSISVIDQSTFSALCALNNLNLNSNKLGQIKSRDFNSMGCMKDKLRNLDLRNNPIAQIEADSFPTSLVNLDLSSNRLERIKLGQFRGLLLLANLWLNNNLISSIERGSFDDLVSVQHLALDQNCLFEIDMNTFNNMRVLNRVILSFNTIQTIKPSDRPLGIKIILLRSNILSELDIKVLQRMAHLQILDLSNNFLRALPWCNQNDPSEIKFLESIIELDVSDNRQLRCQELNPHSIMNKLTTLGLANINSDFIQHINLTSLPELRALELSRNGHRESNLLLSSNLTFLNLSQTFIKSSKYNELGLSLRELDLSYSLNYYNNYGQYFVQLTELRLVHCNITTLDSINSSRNLLSLDLSYNQITEIRQNHLSKSLSLNILKLRGNQISFIESDSFKLLDLSLIILDLGENRLISVSFYFNYMVFMYLDNNQLKDASFQLTSGLIELNLDNNNLKDIPSGYLINVDDSFNIFSLASNQIKIILNTSFSSLSSLTKISMSNNQIDVIQHRSFLKQTLLVDLDLSYNRLSGQLDDDTFTGLISLTNLNMSDNLIEYVQKALFVELFNLESLDLSYNPIKHVEDYSFTRQSDLKFLYFKHCFNFTTFTVNTFDGLDDTLEILYLNYEFFKSQAMLKTLITTFKPRLVKRVIDIDYYNGLDVVYSPYLPFNRECQFTIYLLRTNSIRLNLHKESRFDKVYLTCLNQPFYD